MFKQWIQSRTLSLLAAALTAAYTLASPVHAQDIKVGFNADQSGTAVAELGIAARHGFDLAIAQVHPEHERVARQ
jgi:branched-chain amino acid transport system substrate-binding protein